MLIFDSHLDLGLNAIDWNRDLRQSVDDIRAQERHLGMAGEKGRCTNTVSFPELRKAEVGIGVATVLARQEVPINHPMGYTTPEACYAVAMSHLAYYRAMERGGHMRLLRTRGELQRHVADYEQGTLRPPGFILSMECADPVLDPENIFEWHELGLRAIGITHYGPNRYGGGTRSEVGLAVDALPLLKNIAKLGIALDLTHLSDKAFWQVVERFDGRVLASHQNARRFCNWQRQFADEQIRVVIERDGVLGIACDIIMLQEGYVRGVSPPRGNLGARGRQYRPRLSNGGQRASCRHRQRPGRRLRQRTDSRRPGHHRRLAKTADDAAKTRLFRARHCRCDARQLGSILYGSAAELTVTRLAGKPACRESIFTPRRGQRPAAQNQTVKSYDYARRPCHRRRSPQELCPVSRRRPGQPVRGPHVSGSGLHLHPGRLRA